MSHYMRKVIAERNQVDTIQEFRRNMENIQVVVINAEWFSNARVIYKGSICNCSF